MNIQTIIEEVGSAAKLIENIVEQRETFTMDTDLVIALDRRSVRLRRLEGYLQKMPQGSEPNPLNLPIRRTLLELCIGWLPEDPPDRHITFARNALRQVLEGDPAAEGVTGKAGVDKTIRDIICVARSTVMRGPLDGVESKGFAERTLDGAMQEIIQLLDRPEPAAGKEKGNE